MIGTYVLNEDGSVPKFVIDGGYFPVPCEGRPPQDMILVGVVTEDSPDKPFVDEAALLAYVAAIGRTDPIGEAVKALDSLTADIASVEKPTLADIDTELRAQKALLATLGNDPVAAASALWARG